MKVIGIMCSPRISGNTEILTHEALEGARESTAEIEMLRICEMKISPCDGCEACHRSGKCRIKDDMQKVYKKMLAADAIILSSPVYFWSVSSQAKTFMDRTYALRYPYHKLRNKVGAAIVVTGRRGSVNALTTINNFFLGHDMLVAGLGISGHGTKKGEVKQDHRAMQDARSLGKQTVELTKSLHSQTHI